MKSFLIVLPSIYPLWTDRCLRTMSPLLLNNLLLIDNTTNNIGVTASWNRGFNKVMEDGLDWLILMSAAIRFGENEGNDFIEELQPPQADYCIAIEAAHGVGWHLIAFPRHVLKEIGPFDEGFFSYYSDLDYSRRIALRYDLNPPYWKKVSVDVSLAGFAHGIELGNAAVRGKESELRYIRKWGGLGGGNETFDTPFGGLESKA